MSRELAGGSPDGDGLRADGLASPSTEKAAGHFKGAHFPASKASLVECARNRGAGQDVLEALESFPDGEEFATLADVLRAYARSGEAPQTGVIDVKP